MLYRSIGTLLALFQISLFAYAADEQILPATPDENQIYIAVQVDSGLISATPGMTRDGLLRKIATVRSNLQKRQAQLEELEKQRKFGIVDGIITAAMPGGLLYAAIRKQRHQEVTQRLDAVNLELNQLEQELIAYRALSSAPKLLAAAQ